MKIVFGLFAFCAVIIAWIISAHLPRKDIERTRYQTEQSGGYDDQIRLPVEAFGAHWRINNFRKNVKFPDGLADALPRAIAAANLLGRPANISFAPRVYTLKQPLDLTSAHGVTITGANLNASQVDYAVIVRSPNE